MTYACFLKTTCVFLNSSLGNDDGSRYDAPCPGGGVVKFSESWLREWVNPPVSTAELVEQLTMAGLEVDSVEPVAPQFSDVIVAQVRRVGPHPNADKLKVCEVDAGVHGQLQIVCGAPNVATGMKAPLALVGAVLPDGTKIRRSKLRGVESMGVLCSAVELGLADSAEGLMDLEATLEAGEDLRSALQLDDRAIDIDLTPNRGDCLSVMGVAREVGMLNSMDVRPPKIDNVKAVHDSRFEVVVHAESACPRYVGRVVKAVNTQALTPVWMQERLRRSGLRSINAVVDVTNYVLLELGQPMHAFDLDKLQGRINVRMAHHGERLTLLDGQEVELGEDTLVIADHQDAIAMAGVMGGQASAVTEATKDIFFESAFFAPEAIAGRARNYGLQTDSSHRFERGVDPELAATAIERATSLLLEIAGGQPGPVVETRADSFLPKPQSIEVRRVRVRRLIGLEIGDDRVSDILQRLALRIDDLESGWRVTPPSFRFDIQIEADVIEEIARIYGYNRIPSNLPNGQLTVTGGARRGHDIEVCQALVHRGYQEVVTYSFVDADLQQRIYPGRTALPLSNPIAADLSVMRLGLWPSLLHTVRFNHRRQCSRVRIFEIANRYQVEADGVREEPVLAAAASGSVVPEQWGTEKREVDFFDMKADLASLLSFDERLRVIVAAHPALHPGRCACLKDENGVEVGWIGELHPELVVALGLVTGVVLFEITLAALGQRPPVHFQSWSKFPVVRRDIAVIVDDAVSAQDICESVRQSAGTHLSKLQLFDVYRGKGIDSGKKSLALGLTLQSFSRTLTDEEVDDAVSGVVGELKERFGATLRD